MSRGLGKGTLALISACIEVLEVIQPASVRAVCYQLFVRGDIPNMSKNSTNKVSRALVIARERDDVPWKWIVDETRKAERVSSWKNPDAIIRSAVRSYRRNYWQDQPRRVEIWTEKGTVRGTIASILDEYGVTLRVMHGYSSATVVNDIADESLSSEKPLEVFYLGDFDPSGMHMSEVDLPDRLDRYGGDVDLSRLTLTLDQCDHLPSFPLASKLNDPRHRWFAQRYGRQTGGRCWELDALPPPDLREMVEEAILSTIDQDKWDHAIEVEAAETESMDEFLTSWNDRLGGAI